MNNMRTEKQMRWKDRKVKFFMNNYSKKSEKRSILGKLKRGFLAAVTALSIVSTTGLGTGSKNLVTTVNAAEFDPRTVPDHGSGTLRTSSSDSHYEGYMTNVSGDLAGLISATGIQATLYCAESAYNAEINRFFGVSTGTNPGVYEYPARMNVHRTHMNYEYYKVTNGNTVTFYVYTTSRELYDNGGGEYAGYLLNGRSGVRSQHVWTTFTLQIPEIDITVELNKGNSNPSLTQGNPKYTLAGARYGVYNGSQRVGEIVTDGNGYGKWVGKASPSVTTLQLKEEQAPNGYEKNDETLTVNLDGNHHGSVNTTDKPANDPLVISLTKTSEDSVDNPASMADAEFEIKYYNDIYNTLAELPANATRSWTIKTIDTDGYYEAVLDDDHKVSGDEYFRTATGGVTLPIGTITVQETKAPEGYNLEGATLNGNLVADADNNARVLMKIEYSGGLAALRGGNSYTIVEKPIRAGIEVMKHESEANLELQGDVPNHTTTYEIINRNDYDVEAKAADGSTLGVAGKDGVLCDITTDETGYFKSSDNFLSYGSYTIREKNAPEGLLVEGSTTADFTVKEENEPIDLKEGLIDNIIRGGFRIQKNDSEYATRSQGDTNLFTSFSLYNRSASYVIVDNIKYGVGEKIMSFTTNADGYYETADNLLPYGTYEVIEDEAPIGYTKDGTTSKVFSVRNDKEMSDLTYEIFNRVDYGKFSITKVSTGNESGWGEPEEGVEFTAVLTSKIGDGKPYATLDDAIAAIKAGANDNGDIVDAEGNIVLTKHEFAVVVTDAEGNATSNDLAYGTYTIKQTSHHEETIDVEDTAEFVVSEDNQPVKRYLVNNTPIPYYVRIVKKDLQTGKLVSFNGASFQIKDEKGKVVTQKVSDKKYNTFRTANDSDEGIPNGTFVMDVYSDDEKGTIVTPLTLTAGKYTVEEVESPKGFTILTAPIAFELKESLITETDEDDVAVITVTAENKQITGELEVNKKIEDYKADKTFINRDDLSDIEFTLTAVEDVLNADDGTVLTKAGEVAKNIYGEEVGKFHVNKTGYAKITDLPLGKYELVETDAPAGIIMDTTPRSVVFEQEMTGGFLGIGKKLNTEKEVYTVSEDYENKTTKVDVSKTKVTGEDELPGAELTVTDDEGNVVDSWTSGKKSHTIEGLTVGKTYTLTETITPNGFVRATSINFKVNEDGSVTKVHMIDKIVEFDKLDMCETNVDGAQITVTDKDGNIVDQWMTEKNKNHNISGLVAGETYTASETIVPEGYVKAADYTFVAKDDQKDQLEKLVNKQVEISKETTGGKEVKGAKLTITDKESGEVVDSWTSGNQTHYANNLEVGKTYVLTEDTSPLGYVKATEIEFTVTDDGVDQKYTMIDTIERVGKYDENGNLLTGAVLEVVDEDGNVIDTWTSGQKIVDVTEEMKSDLQSGKTVETTTEDGKTVKIFVLVASEKTEADDTNEDEKTAEELKKEACEIKADRKDEIEDVAEVEIPEGASVTYQAMITDGEGNVTYADVDLDGNETTHMIQNAEQGKSYTVREVQEVAGYYYAEDEEIATEADKDHNTSMVDNSINYRIVKVDDKDGSYVEGVTLKLTDITDKDNPVEIELPNNGITTGEPFELGNKLVAEHTYDLEESEIVAGVYKATNIQFTVPKYGTAGMTTITMMDETTNITLKKVDNYGNPVKGALMQILETTTDEEGNVVPATDEEGNEIVVYEFIITDDVHGTDISEYVKGDYTYIARESETPFGFDVTEDVEFTVSGKQDAVQVLLVTDVRKNYYVAAKKQDGMTKKALKGAEITLFNMDGTVAKDVNGKECKGLTDENGMITWNVEYNGDGTEETMTGYYVQETAAPTGYRINKNHFAVELSEDYDFAKDNAVVITVNDEALPSTGVTLPLVAGGLFIAAIAVLVALRKKKETISE